MRVHVHTRPYPVCATRDSPHRNVGASSWLEFRPSSIRAVPTMQCNRRLTASHVAVSAADTGENEAYCGKEPWERDRCQDGAVRKPASKLIWACPAEMTVALPWSAESTRRKRVVVPCPSPRFWYDHAVEGRGSDQASRVGAVLWVGRPSAVGGGLCADHRSRWHGATGSADVWGDDGGPGQGRTTGSTGWPSSRSLSSRPACTGGRCSICWRPITRSSWSMRSTAKPCLDARPMSRRAGGWPICCGMVYSTPASSRRNRSESCAIAPATANRSSNCAPRRSIVSTKCWRRPIASWARWPATWWASVDVACCGPSKPPPRIRGGGSGEADPGVLAELAKGRLREKLPALRLALAGRVQAQHRQLIGELLDHLEYLEYLEYLEQCLHRREAHMADLVAEQEQAVDLLLTLPATGPVSAATILSDHPRGDRHGPDPVSPCGPCGVLGGGLSRQQTERRQAAEWSDDQRQYAAQDHPVRARGHDCPLPRRVSVGALAPHRAATRQAAGHAGGRTPSVGQHLLHAARPRTLP